MTSADQEAFNRVWDHFVTQGNPRSFHPPTKNCMYRGPDGARCAVGVLVSEEDYRPDFEGMRVGAVINDWDPPSLSLVSRRLLTELQFAHDNSEGDALDVGRLCGVAERLELEVPS